ncbi:MAG: PilZ domain-containing protein [bacterium]
MKRKVIIRPRTQKISVATPWGRRRTRRISIGETGEQRGLQRSAVSIPVRCAAPNLAFFCESIDISRTGIALRRGGKLELKRGTSLVVELTLPGEEGPIQLLGEVIRDQPHETGRKTVLEFHPSSRATSYRIAEFVARAA